MPRELSKQTIFRHHVTGQNRQCTWVMRKVLYQTNVKAGFSTNNENNNLKFDKNNFDYLDNFDDIDMSCEYLRVYIKLIMVLLNTEQSCIKREIKLSINNENNNFEFDKNNF